MGKEAVRRRKSGVALVKTSRRDEKQRLIGVIEDIMNSCNAAQCQL